MTKLNYVTYPSYPKKSSRALSINYNGSPIHKKDFNEIVRNIKINNTKSENKKLLCSDDYFKHHRNIVDDNSKCFD